jgi:FkbM family methyltransferase
MNLDVFREFPRWQGRVPAHHEVDFLGHIVSRRYHGGLPLYPARHAAPGYPAPNEEIFEWIALLEAVLTARDTFTMVELGAGYGRWLARAACAIRVKRPQLRMRLIGVEAEPTHFAWMHEHLSRNGVAPHSCTLIHAAVNGTNEPVHFTVGHPEEWYGQAILPSADCGFGDWPQAEVVTMPSVTIPELTAGVDYVDLVDMDIQGAELPCIAQSIGTLTQKVRRVLVATHGDDIHRAIYGILRDAGWQCEAAYGPQSKQQTEFGPINFSDGVQYWTRARNH